MLHEPIQGRYDARNAKALTDFAAAAYGGISDFGFQINDWKSQRINDNLGLGISAVIYWNETDIVVSVRGTELKIGANLLVDADCRRIQVRTPGGRKVWVHAGFWRAYQSIAQDLDMKLIELLTQRFESTRRLWFTGHSMGGGVAELCLLFHGYRAPVKSCYTMGQPRTGGHDLARVINRCYRGFYFRIVHSADIVPRVPHFEWSEASVDAFLFKFTQRYPCGLFWHGGEEIFYDCGSKEHSHWARWKKLPSDLRDIWRALRRGHFSLIEDHYVAEYQGLFAKVD